MDRVINCKELNISSRDILEENSLDKLKEYHREVNFIIASVKEQIEGYKVAYINSGVSGDYSWFKRAKAKVTLYGFFTQEIQQRMSAVKKVRKIKKHNDVRNLFIDNAKEMLSSVQFEQILEKSISQAELMEVIR
ncbi:MAG: hypothetical protein Unbinned4388contig1000_41 [Prokaryotic dsDNA virus sp.]|nr:MAG: hypothetical protein Unbinned4388contig1000_41 [Prokaryotic dsDNA virus sp.]|tara:strand:- start:60324 stop:60728 length:405 start_codon:yes stop_codon:yes gene_type:complete